MVEKFINWFVNLLCQIEENIKNAKIIIIVFAFCIVTLPVWIIPFVYWYFECKKNATNKSTTTNADRIRAMGDEELAVFMVGLNEHCLAGIGECDCSRETKYCSEICEKK